ncbi:cytochrome P450 [Mycena pura]|uniref:Cytochrome P450 n=1 Tax=Mycena pura TaxID=153505 RepID=A0AAD6V8Z7_9AGAR|nr:cytochrome P450 [Mycena pura]
MIPFMDDPRFLFLYGILALVGVAWIRKSIYESQVDEIPVIGSTGFFSSYRDALKFIFNAPELIKRGYEQHPNGVFRLARLYRWEFVVCGTKLAKEVANAPEDTVSFHGGVEDSIQISLTMGREISRSHYLQDVIRTSLTRNLHTCFPEVRDEIVCAFDDVLQLTGSDWQTVQVVPTIRTIVSRVSNRLFVGLPLCRNRDYLENNANYAVNVMQSAKQINLFPPFLRPLVGRLVSSKNENFDIAMKHLGTIVEERLAKEDELGPDWPEKPNDLISWLLAAAQGSDRTVPNLVRRVLQTNMAAIHTSTNAFSLALYDLTAHPEHFLPMREEAERVVARDGWSKAALNNMHKIDSFLRESQRLVGIGPVVMVRRVVGRDGFRLSNGTVVPYGSYLYVAARAAQHDPTIYEDAEKFDGFRFAREREAQKANDDPNKDIFKRHMISTAPDHLAFGTGKHACPGRFFAATELKAMLAHLVINYDIKAEVEGLRPPDLEFGVRTSPNPSGKVLFRKRQ